MRLTSTLVSRRSSTARPSRPPGLWAAALLAGVVLLGGCQGSDDPDPSPSSPSSATAAPEAGPCLIGSEELTEITGVAQEVAEPREDGATTNCETAVDERSVGFFWTIEERDEAPTVDELRDEVEAPGAEPERTTLDGDTEAWVAEGSSPEQPFVEVLLAVEGRVVQVVGSTVPSGEEPVAQTQLVDETLAAADAIAAGLGAGSGE